MSRDGFRPVNDSGSRSGDALARLDEAAKQLELAMADVDGKWQEAAIGALRADLASLQGFETAADRAEPRFGPQFHEPVDGKSHDGNGGVRPVPPGVPGVPEEVEGDD